MRPVRRQRTLATFSICCAVLLTVTVLGGESETDNATEGKTKVKSISEPKVDDQGKIGVVSSMQEVPETGGAGASERLAQSRSQWPADKRERVKALNDRVERVTKSLNDACGTNIVVMLSETGRGGEATGTGTVFVDFSIVWRISEDALAALLAHEFGHEVLGHAREWANLKYYSPSLPSRLQQLCELEQKADAFAGQALSRTAYSVNGFKELMALAQDTEWADPEIRAYYPNIDRYRTVSENYESARTPASTDQAVQTTAEKKDI